MLVRRNPNHGLIPAFVNTARRYAPAVIYGAGQAVGYAANLARAYRTIVGNPTGGTVNNYSLGPVGHSSYARGSRSVARRYRRGTKLVRFGRRKRKSKTSKPRNHLITQDFQTKVRLAMTSPDQKIYKVIESYSTTGSTTNVKPCKWFSSNSDLPLTSCDPVVWKGFAYAYDSAAAPANQSFNQRLFRTAHKISNMTNVEIRLEAYLMRARMDLSNLAGSNTILGMMGEGFASKAVDPTNPNNGNSGLTNDDYRLWDTGSFLSFFKCVKSKKMVMAPGQTMAFSIKDAKDYTINVRKWCHFAAGDTYSSAILNYVWTRGEKFWLFKICSNTISDNNGTGAASFPPIKVNVETLTLYSIVNTGQFGQSQPTILTSGITAASTPQVVAPLTGAITAVTNA